MLILPMDPPTWDAGGGTVTRVPALHPPGIARGNPMSTSKTGPEALSTPLWMAGTMYCSIIGRAKHVRTYAAERIQSGPVFAHHSK